jgi:twitching motility protein PilT
MVEDKDRTKEIPQAIAQSYTTYGMQTFDQSLMQLFRSNIITYEEALRQSSNPDDFALRVSGISATSDATWDQFDKRDEQPQSGKPSARPAPPARLRRSSRRRNRRRATTTSRSNASSGRLGGRARPRQPRCALARCSPMRISSAA